jgi:hypothetical protein
VPEADIAANPHAYAYRLVAFRGRTIRVITLRRRIDIIAGRRIDIVAVRGWSVGVIALRGVSIRRGRQIVAICWRVVPIRDRIPISPVITSPIANLLDQGDLSVCIAYS